MLWWDTVQVGEPMKVGLKKALCSKGLLKPHSLIKWLRAKINLRVWFLHLGLLRTSKES